METLIDIVNSATTIQDSSSTKKVVAKELLRNSNILPIEKSHLIKTLNGRKGDFLEGYDDIYSRVDLSKIRDSVKEHEGKYFHSFAIYDIFAGTDCTYEYKVNFSTIGRFTRNQLNVIDSPTSHILRLMMRSLVLRLDFSRFMHNLIPVAFVGLMLGGLFAGIFYGEGYLKTYTVFKWITILSGSYLVFKMLLSILVSMFGNYSEDYISTHTSEFSGLIPSQVKDTISKVRNRFDRLFLVQEASTWIVNGKTYNISNNSNMNPLLIGEINGIHYLIDIFKLETLDSIASERSNNTLVNLDKEF